MMRRSTRRSLRSSTSRVLSSRAIRRRLNGWSDRSGEPSGPDGSLCPRATAKNVFDTDRSDDQRVLPGVDEPEALASSSRTAWS